MALKMPKLFGESKPKLAAAEAELDMPTTQVKMGASAPSGYDPLASVSVMEQLRAATAKSIAPWKLPLIGDMPVAKQLSVLGTVFGTALVLALLMILLDNRAASQGAADTATATEMQMLWADWLGVGIYAFWFKRKLFGGGRIGNNIYSCRYEFRQTWLHCEKEF